MEDETYNRHIRDIVALRIEIKQLNLKINKKNTEIEQLKKWNKEIIKGAC